MPGFSPAVPKNIDTKIVPSNSGIIGDSAQRSTNSLTYVKIAAFQIPSNVHTTLARVGMRICSYPDNATIYGRVYKNGVALGTEHSMASTTCQTFEEDLSIGNPGNSIELYMKATDSSVSAYCLSFYIHGDESEIALDWTQIYP